MGNLLRKPLTWMVLAEFTVVAALVIVAWHLVAASGVTAVPALPFVSPPAQAGNATDALPADLIQQSKAQDPRLLPGLNLSASFWRSRLAELNQGEAAFEALEWKIVHAAMDAAQRYVESVVLPSVARAARSGR
jgi:hypothetical protein